MTEYSYGDRWWLERQRVDYGGGFGGHDVTRADYGRLPPKPLNDQRSVMGSSAGTLIKDSGNFNQHVRDVPTKAYTPPSPPKPRGPYTPHRAHHSAAMRAAWARRKAAQQEAKLCPVNSAD